MAEIIGVIIGAIVTIGKIIYDECKKVGKQVTSCGDPPRDDPPHHDDDVTPVPDDGEEKIHIELGRATIKRILLKNIGE
jgi:hypothetical protein